MDDELDELLDLEAEILRENQPPDDEPYSLDAVGDENHQDVITSNDVVNSNVEAFDQKSQIEDSKWSENISFIPKPTKSIESLANFLKNQRSQQITKLNSAKDTVQSKRIELFLDKFSHLATSNEATLRQICNSDFHQYNQKYLHKIPLLSENNFQTIVTKNFVNYSESGRFFLRDYQKSDKNFESTNVSNMRLLDRSMSDIYRECEELQLKKQLHLEQFRKPNRSFNTQQSELWVSKYSPQSFLQLLSPEKTNREVMRALKRWDYFVFKKPLPKAGGELAEELNHLEEDRRPRKKVILLAGLPGIGKTTIAQVLAAQCGYQTVEVNASDDRAPEKLREILQRSTQNQTLSFSATSASAESSKRPNCIIFDEIDGAESSRAMINMLLEILQQPLASQPTARGKPSSKKTSAFALTRPLICICNDQYTPLIREIRPFAEIFTLPRPPESRFIARLREIYSLEYSLHWRRAISAQLLPNSALQELAAATNFDIRSSINHLQLLAQELWQFEAALEEPAPPRQRELTTGVSRSEELFRELAQNKSNLQYSLQQLLANKLKDIQSDYFQLLRKIFFAELPKHPLQQTPQSSSSQSAQSNSFLLAIDAALEFDDENQFIAAMHENIFHIERQQLQREHPTSSPSAGQHRRRWPTRPANAEYTAETFRRISHAMQRAMNNSRDSSRREIPVDLHRLGGVLDLLSEEDCRSKFINEHFSADVLSLRSYRGVLGGAIHYAYTTSPRFASISTAGSTALTWPHQTHEMLARQQQSANILSLLREQSRECAAYGRLSTEDLAVDVVNSLLRIISPQTRNIAFLSMTLHEQMIITHAAAAMQATGLRYLPKTDSEHRRGHARNDADSAAHLKFTLEPDISLLAYDPEKKRHALAEEVKEMIMTEQKRISLANLKNKSTASESSASQTNLTPSKRKIEQVENIAKVLPESKRNYAISGFFQNKKKPLEESEAEEKRKSVSENKSQAQEKIFFRYRNGFSNAVKRNVNLYEFISMHK